MTDVVEKMLAAFKRKYSPDFPESGKHAMRAALDAFAENVTDGMVRALVEDKSTAGWKPAIRAAILAAKAEG